MKLWKFTRPIPKLLRGDRLLRSLISGGRARKHGAGSDGLHGCSAEMGRHFRWKVISEYGRVLELGSSPIEQERDLPFPKEIIRQAICEELTENPLSELRSHLEVAFVQLESYLPAEEYKVIEEFKAVSTLAQEMARSGDPNDIVASARILKAASGDRAVKIQERISEKMRKRLQQVRSFGGPVMGRIDAMDACALCAEC